nr:class I SAM-dependent methyltransferase [uncultured Methanoregula sp.]
MQRSSMAGDASGTHHARASPSGTAEGVAAFRAIEAGLPEEERICNDTYAVRFVDPSRLAWIAEHPDHPFPGLRNTIVARVRFFDDMITAAVGEGLEQLVIMGAGYDSRAYRIDAIRHHVRVFEIDHPDTQVVKTEKIREIFGELPNHVTYVPVDFATQDFGMRLFECGFSKTKKTLFVMEGLLMYLPLPAIDAMLSFIARNSARGSSILFDCSPRTGAGDAPDRDARRELRDHVARHGEPIRFVVPPEGIGAFLAERQFSLIRTVTCADYESMYFHGKNKDRVFYRPLTFFHAVTG